MKPPLTLTSDGTSHGTRIVDADGKWLTNVKSITLHIDAEGPTRATIEVIFLGADCHIPADAVMIQLPWIATMPTRARHLWYRITCSVQKFYYACSDFARGSRKGS